MLCWQEFIHDYSSHDRSVRCLCLLHRPEYYGLTEVEEGNSTAGLASVITSKYRSGALGEDILRWEAKLTKFSDYSSVGENMFSDMKPNDEFDKDPF